MSRHYFLHFLRNLKRHKLFSIINLLGLTTSVTCTLLIYMYVSHEFSYDRFHADADRIYRINQTFIWGDNSDNQFASTGPGVAYAVKSEIPEVELITSIHTPGNSIISYTDAANDVRTFEENRILAADTNFFTMFNFPLVHGEVSTALSQANTLVMTESTSRKYFGDTNPIGKLVRLAGPGKEVRTYEVTGVAKDLPDNSYIQFDVLLSLKGFNLEQIYWSWIWTQLETFVRFQEGTDMQKVEATLQRIPRKHAEETLVKVMNTTFDEYTSSGRRWELFLQPLASIHLPSTLVYSRVNDSGNLKTVYSLVGAGIVILLLACVNFMNLSTAQFTRRVKEASVRKILGQGKNQLVTSFLLEAFVFCLFALLMALAATQALLPAFNLTTGKHLELNITDPDLLLTLAATVILMSLLSGAYPAWFLNKFNPVEAIRGRVTHKGEGKSFRNGLVVFQFAISILLMISTAVVFQQLTYINQKDLGFDRENLMVLKHVEQLKNGESLVAETLRIPGVVGVSQCTSLPPNIYGGDKFTGEGMDGASVSLNFTTGDEHYISTLAIALKAGRNFYGGSDADSNKVILNESAVRTFGWEPDETVVGETIYYPNDNTRRFEVIGVIGDFNYWSLETKVEPMAIFHLANSNVFGGDRRYLAVRVQPQDGTAWEKTISGIESLWKKHAGDSPFDYSFVDQAFAESFKTSQRLGQVLTVLALLAIMIACLGLLAIIMYSMEHRMKEICIRKISGASAVHILLLISRRYVTLIFVAFFIAAPLAYWLMNEWLQDFAYRVIPSAGLFVLSGLAALFLALIITGYHAMRAAFINPVEILRNE